MTKWFATFCIVLSQAATQHLVVHKGDTFNQILKRHKVSSTSLHQINASSRQLPLLSSLNPGDRITLFTCDKSHQLLSASIKTQKDHFILNKTAQRYEIKQAVVDDKLTIVSVDSEENTLDPNKIRAQRAQASLFPNKKGLITAAISNGHILSIKLTGKDIQYAFLHQPKTGLPIYVNSDKTYIASVIASTPLKYKRISSPFNPERLHPISKKVMPHKGVDLAAPINTPIWAAADGVVTHRSSDTGYGNMLIIEHQHGIQTYYGHMNKFHNDIRVGQKVKAYETIGYVGSTGHSTGPHLHFETRINGIPYDPLTFSSRVSPKLNKGSIDLSYYF